MQIFQNRCRPSDGNQHHRCFGPRFAQTLNPIIIHVLICIRWSIFQSKVKANLLLHADKKSWSRYPRPNFFFHISLELSYYVIQLLLRNFYQSILLWFDWGKEGIESESIFARPLHSTYPSALLKRVNVLMEIFGIQLIQDIWIFDM